MPTAVEYIFVPVMRLWRLERPELSRRVRARRWRRGDTQRAAAATRSKGARPTRRAARGASGRGSQPRVRDSREADS